jgi:hypothetical protein
MLAVHGYGLWTAILIAIATGLDEAPRAARWLARVLVVAAVLASLRISVSGMLRNPYRTDGYQATDAYLDRVPALRSIQLRGEVAERLSGLRRALEPYIEPRGRAMMGFDEIGGVLLLLDGRPVGEAWASAADRPRTADGLRGACRGGAPWWGTRWPVLVFRRPVTEIETRALADCGIQFASDYALVASVSEVANISLSVYAPTREAHPTQ